MENEKIESRVRVLEMKVDVMTSQLTTLSRLLEKLYSLETHDVEKSHFYLLEKHRTSIATHIKYWDPIGLFDSIEIAESFIPKGKEDQYNVVKMSINELKEGEK